MEIELVTLHYDLRGKKRSLIVTDTINRSRSDLILFCGHSLIYEDDAYELGEQLSNKESFVVFETKIIQESDFVKYKHGLFVIENGIINNLFTNQLFSTKDEIEGNEVLCERFIVELETRRRLTVKNQNILILQCGEINIIKNLQSQNNDPVFRLSQRTDLQNRFNELLSKTHIILNPIHTPMGNQGKMQRRREYLSANNRYYFSVSQNGERKIDARSLQYAYHNGTKLIENAIEISNDYQIRYFKIKSQNPRE